MDLKSLLLRDLLRQLGGQAFESGDGSIAIDPCDGMWMRIDLDELIQVFDDYQDAEEPLW